MRTQPPSKCNALSRRRHCILPQAGAQLARTLLRQRRQFETELKSMEDVRAEEREELVRSEEVLRMERDSLLEEAQVCCIDGTGHGSMQRRS